MNLEALERKIEEEKRHKSFLENVNQRNVQYSEYLKSPKWKTIRNKVMIRDNHTCQGCLAVRAEEVHHKTYANVGNELMYQLISLCRKCHKTAHDKKNRGGLGPISRELGI